MRQLILSADDFGIARSVNAAIESAHRNGVLTSASLMVSAKETADAVARARALPKLGVGLHLVLADGRPVLPPEQVPDLIGRNGEFSANMVAAGFHFALSRSARSQLEAEIHAQFAAYLATGLELDHVDVHKHFHLHPIIAALLLRIGPQYGMRALRLPIEPALTRSRPGAAPSRQRNGLVTPWTRRLKKQLERAQLIHNDYVFGLADTGQMTETTVLRLLDALPEGLSEMYFHPACPADARVSPRMRNYRHYEEFQALVSQEVRERIQALGIHCVTYGEIAKRKSPYQRTHPV